MYDKEQIDVEAEAEAAALKKQGIKSANYNRIRLINDKTYNAEQFNKLFKD